jgi:uncharacterized protein (TIGR00296 family)
MDIGPGKTAVELARRAIEVFLLSNQKISPPDDLPIMFEELRGVFVTLNSGMLRGCIGYPYPIMKLKDAIIDAAISAAVYDYRFPPVNVSELDAITIEVTILTRPKRIRSAEEIKVGQHGVIVKKGVHQGLLLPQVATEYNWTSHEFLSHTFEKAGLSSDTLGAKLYVFEGQIFEEVEPHGDVVEKCIC